MALLGDPLTPARELTRSTPPAVTVSVASEERSSFRPYDGMFTYELTPADDYSDRGDDLSSSRAKARHVAAVVVALVAILTCGAMFYAAHSPADKRTRLNSIMSAVGIDRAAVAPWIKPKPELCNLGIVLDFCLKAAEKAPSYYDGNPASPKAVISADSLSKLLTVSLSSVTAFFDKIDVVGTEKGVSCENLCKETVSSFGSRELPSMVDVGCYLMPAGSSSPVSPKIPTCDVDLSVPVILPDQAPASGKGSYSMKKLSRSLGPHPKYDELLHPNVSFHEMQLSVARLFRMYPASLLVSSDIKTGWLDRRLEAPERKLWDDSCVTALNGKCEVPFSCADGTDCTDCGTCNGRKPDDECKYSKDDMCDEPAYCEVGTDCTDCGTCGKPAHNPPLAYQPADYPELILQSGTNMQGILRTALMVLASGRGSDVLETFLGYDDSYARVELRRIINGGSRLLDNIKYVYPGADCSGEGGYMEDAEGGGLVMNLCKPFVDGDDSERYMTMLGGLIETVTKPLGAPVYGWRAVTHLADVCKHSKQEGKEGKECKQVLKNPESILYIIGSLVDLEL